MRKIGSVVEVGTYADVRDEHGSQISQKCLCGGHVMGYTQTTYTIRYSNRVETYDANSSQLSIRYC